MSQIGQLKTIGMTEKQIKRMIRKEGYRFCLFGIPTGITVGIIFAYLLEPNGITIINAIATSIFAIILGIIIVQISVYKPAQIASNISPIEATKYVGNDPELKESRVRNRKNHIRLYTVFFSRIERKAESKKTQSDDCLACNRRDFIYGWSHFYIIMESRFLCKNGKFGRWRILYYD